jgi:hypothetical protein
MNLCRHEWSFPRRRATCAEHRNVDVQTCSKCGAQRVSPIQFGRIRPDTGIDTEVIEPAEVRS